ncbi:hypothetical protein B0T13DRAFT_456099 [Neurospora crassa]|nr:hypothetical protein B0T13DRAFT_456099 [Neurospora crassa]
MWNTLDTACLCDNGSQDTAALAERQPIECGIRLTRYLEAHQSFKDLHGFLIAKQMPQLRAVIKAHDRQRHHHQHRKRNGRRVSGGPKEDMGEAANHELTQQHRTIHLGMEQFEKGLKNCRSKEEAFNLPMLEHLDQEVEELGRGGVGAGRRRW